jgi:hypothetical protein
MGLALAARVVFAPAAEPLGSAALVGVTLLGFMFWMMEASTRSVGWPVGEAKLGGAA